jgi:ABC-type transporter Mla subunit MlaD
LDVTQVILAVGLAVVGVTCVAAIWALRDFVATSRSLRAASDDIRERVVPLLEKADITVDAANMELLRIDAIITRFEDTSSRVSSASATITDIVNAPADLVTEAATRVRRAWKDRKRTHSAQSEGTTDEQSSTRHTP